jgi:hypothetical protein
MNERIELRLLDLLADRATGSLEREGAMELDALLEQYPDWNDDRMDLAAAAADLAMFEETQPLPDALRDRIKTDARAYMQTAAASPVVSTIKPAVEADVPSAPVRTGRLMLTSGWLAAAALLVIALLGWLRDPPKSTEPGLQARWQTLQTTADLVAMDFAGTEDEAATGASGQVVWSADRQTGMMRISGLAANDPGVNQYQLWIFDKDRDDRYPIDGGVFDVSGGDVLIPIDAKLEVRDPQLFAVTVERPGGVVVSSRERIVLLAQPAS